MMKFISELWSGYYLCSLCVNFSYMGILNDRIQQDGMAPKDMFKEFLYMSWREIRINMTDIIFF